MMKNERKFFENINLTAIFIEEMLITGADSRDIEELLFGSPLLPARLPCFFSLPTSYSIWKNRKLEEEKI